MARAVLAVFGIVILAALGVYVFEAGLYAAGDQETVRNETWTVNTGTFVSLNDSDKTRATYDDTVTVYNNTTSLMTAGVDYEWDDTDGRIKALSGGNLTDGNESTITYRYSVASQQQERLAGLLALIPDVIAPAIIVFAFIIAMVMLR